MKFSANKFRKDRRYRHILPNSNLAVLDGMAVINEGIYYEVDGEEWYLYPVLPEWCEEKQS